MKKKSFAQQVNEKIQGIAKAMPTKHTPGPWIMDYDGTKGHIKAVNGRKDPRGFSQTPTVAKYDWFAQFRHMGDVSISEEEEKANARLIASAPELLEALKCAMYSTQSIIGSLTGNQKRMMEVSVKSWAELIAKAEGRE